MSDRQGQDTKADVPDELSFELREMLHMLGRIEDAEEPLAEGTAEDTDLEAFAL